MIDPKRFKEKYGNHLKQAEELCLKAQQFDQIREVVLKYFPETSYSTKPLPQVVEEVLSRHTKVEGR